MGILDRVIKRGANKLKNSVAGAISEAVKDAINGDSRNDDYERQPASASAAPVSQQTAPARKDKAFFEDLIAAEFGASYDVRSNVSPSVIGGSGRDYDFGLYKGGALKAAIMLTEHNRDRNAAFLGAKQACADAGVPFINFYFHMPNERGYVVDRIKSFL